MSSDFATFIEVYERIKHVTCHSVDHIKTVNGKKYILVGASYKCIMEAGSRNPMADVIRSMDALIKKYQNHVIKIIIRDGKLTNKTYATIDVINFFKCRMIDIRMPEACINGTVRLDDHLYVPCNINDYEDSRGKAPVIVTKNRHALAMYNKFISLCSEANNKRSHIYSDLEKDIIEKLKENSTRYVPADG